jgi:uncharacterized protein (TIRG00374 family)
VKRPDAPTATRWAIACLVGLAALSAWWGLLGGPETVRALGEADLALVLAGFLLVALAQLFRLLRWHLLLRAVGDVAFGRTLRILYASELLNTFLPVKLGDAGRALAVSAIPPFTLGSAVATIVVDRFSGILVRLAVTPLALFVPLAADRALLLSATACAGLLLAATGTIVLLDRRPALLSALARWGLRFLPERLRGPIEGTLAHFVSSFVSLALAPAATARLLLLSLLALGLQAAGFWLFFRAAGATLGVLTALVGTAFLDLLAVLPAPPAGLGVAEWSVTFVFAWALGAPLVATSVAALAAHGLWLLLVIVLGAVSASAVPEMLQRRSAP